MEPRIRHPLYQHMFDTLSRIPSVSLRRKARESASFDKPPSDSLGLRTANGIEHHVSELTLKEASAFFKDLITIPQTPSSPTNTTGPVPASQTVDIPEHSRVWDSLLKFLLPVRPPALFSTEDIVSLMEAATKYDMPHVRSLLRHQLAVKAIDDPLKVYALASRLGWEAEMRIAARAYLLLEPPENQELYLREMEGMSVAAYSRLHKYRTACSAAVGVLFSAAPSSLTARSAGADDLQTPLSYECLCIQATDRPWVKTTNPKQSGYSKIAVRTSVRTWVPGSRRQSTTVWAQDWWVECMLRAMEKLKSRPHDGVMTAEFFSDFVFESAASQPHQKKLLMPAMSKFQCDFLAAVKQAVDNVKLEIAPIAQ